MRKSTRDKLTQILSTVIEGVEYCKAANSQQISTVLDDCCLAVKAISDALKTNLSAERFFCYSEMFNVLKSTLQSLNAAVSQLNSITDLCDSFNNQINNIIVEIKNEPEVKLEVVFMPYKASMWDSLESIWRSAAADPSCDAYVIPIPYYDRNPDHSFGEFHYEGELFPPDVPITHYDKYDLASRKPDIIYIHNPYDDCNYVTSVDPRFYSFELKKYTDMLVYVPYYIPAVCYNDLSEVTNLCNAPAYIHANKIIVLSEVFGNALIASGCSKNKIEVLGTPKIDYAIKNTNVEYTLPQEWKERLNGKKVFLLNTSITSFLQDSNWRGLIKATIESLINNASCALIWRPHPLLESTIKSMCPKYLDLYLSIKQLILKSSSAVFDDTPNADLAFYASDVMVSDYSSLFRQYIITGKPVLSVSMGGFNKPKYVSFDYFSCYFPNEMYWSEFVQMIIAGEDPKREERINNMKKSIPNSNGTCGEKVHQYIKNQVL